MAGAGLKRDDARGGVLDALLNAVDEALEQRVEEAGARTGSGDEDIESPAEEPLGELGPPPTGASQGGAERARATPPEERRPLRAPLIGDPLPPPPEAFDAPEPVELPSPASLDTAPQRLRAEGGAGELPSAEGDLLPPPSALEAEAEGEESAESVESVAPSGVREEGANSVDAAPAAALPASGEPAGAAEAGSSPLENEDAPFSRRELLEPFLTPLATAVEAIDAEADEELEIKIDGRAVVIDSWTQAVVAEALSSVELRNLASYRVAEAVALEIKIREDAERAAIVCGKATESAEREAAALAASASPSCEARSRDEFDDAPHGELAADALPSDDAAPPASAEGAGFAEAEVQGAGPTEGGRARGLKPDHRPRLEPGDVADHIADDFVRDAALGRALVAELQKVIDASVVGGRMDQARHLSTRRNQLKREVNYVESLLSETQLQSALDMVEALFRLPEDARLPEIKPRRRRRRRSGELQEGVIVREGAQIERVSDPRRVRRMSIALVAAVALWAALIVPRLMQPSLQEFKLADFSHLPSVTAIVVRPPSLYVQLDGQLWGASSERERLLVVEDVAHDLERASYSGALFFVGETEVVARWQRGRGVYLTKSKDEAAE